MIKTAKWEYASVALVQEQRNTRLKGDKEVLNKYGLEGWELVSVFPVQTTKGLDAVAYFKRQIE